MEMPPRLRGDATHWDDRRDDDCWSQPGALFRLMKPDEQQRLLDNTARSTPRPALNADLFSPPNTPLQDEDMNKAETHFPIDPTRRHLLGSGACVVASLGLPLSALADTLPNRKPAAQSGTTKGNPTMSNTIVTKDGTEIYYKDWGPKGAQPIMFHHGWPLSSDDWDTQMLFFVQRGFRVVAHDRRGHGRSAQVSDGHDMDHYASDAFAVAEHLDLKNVVHIGHSTGGGEVARYVARHGQPSGRVAKAVLVSAVPPLMVKTASNPEGLPMDVFDGFRKGVAENRAQLFLDVAGGPFYGFNRSGAKTYPGVIQNWWRQGMMGSAKAHHDGIKAFSETDQTDDLKAITVPTLVMHGDDDQIVPIADAALKSIKLLKNGMLKVYKGYPHGMLTTHADVINPDLLAFIKGAA
jgi:non-heme chloroperoxidase